MHASPVFKASNCQVQSEAPELVVSHGYRHLAEGDVENVAIDVVFAADRAFMPFFIATLSSLVTSAKPDDHLRVWLLTDHELDCSERAEIERLRRKNAFDFSSHLVTASKFSNLRTSKGISDATYYRLIMHQVLPRHVTKVLYLDSDLLIRGSIAALFGMDIDHYYFAGVEDSLSLTYREKFHQTGEAAHANAGVLLCNLQKMRTAEFDERLSSFLQAWKYRIVLGDQQIIMGAFGAEIAYIHPTWNLHGSMHDPKWRERNIGITNGFTSEVLADAVKDPRIVHFTLNRKPWQKSDHPYATGFMEHLNATPLFRASPPPAKSKCGVPGTKAMPPRERRELAAPRANARLDDRLNATARRVEISERIIARTLLDRLEAQRQQLPLQLDATLARVGEFAKVAANLLPRDLDGGESEYYKILFRTNRFVTPETKNDWDDADLVCLCRWKQNDLWQLALLEHAVQRDIPLFFVETAFFAACATWAARDLPAHFRKPIGFIVDDRTFYYDSTHRSKLLEWFDGSAELTFAQRDEATRLIRRIIDERITKYNFLPQDRAILAELGARPGKVLVVDQGLNDASITLGGATRRTFERMLTAAVAENPDADIVVKLHPDSLARSGRAGYFAHIKQEDRIFPVNVNVNPHVILDEVDDVYVVTSQLGFEALLRGKRVHVFGRPFYAGWGLTDDRQPMNRARQRSAEELFYGACVLHSAYVDPTTGERCSLDQALNLVLELREEVIPYLAAQERCLAETREGPVTDRGAYRVVDDALREMSQRQRLIYGAYRTVVLPFLGERTQRSFHDDPIRYFVRARHPVNRVFKRLLKW